MNEVLLMLFECPKVGSATSLVPGPIFANITAGEKYGLVLIVCACALF